MPGPVDWAAAGRTAGRELWPAGASWIPDAVTARFEELAARHPALGDEAEAEAARAAFIAAARDARRSAPTSAESRGRRELLERLHTGNAARTAATREDNDAAGVERDPQAAAIARRRRASLERRRRA